jgi:hypothetical protein
MMIDINKEYKTRDGQDVSLYKVCLDDCPVLLGYIGEKRFIWDLQGNFENVFVESDLDLIEVVETEAKDTSAMKIDITKKYKTRDGRGVRVIKIHPESEGYEWPVVGCFGEERVCCKFWNLEGKYDLERESDLDLIEVIETATPPKSSNPKDIIGLTKPSLSAVPMRSVYEMSKAMNDGASKYGRFNWRENSVDSDVYIDATLRHLNSWQDGENTAQDSRVHHLAHAMACLSIIIDAELGGNLIDSRSKISTGGVADYLAANTKESNA